MSHTIRMKRANAVIVASFGLHPDEPAMVKKVDARMADTESRDLRGVVEGSPFAHIRVIPWTPGAASRRFIARHHEIIEQWGRPWRQHPGSSTFVSA